LAEVQHVGSGGAGDVGAVVDGQQRAVASRGIGENLQGGEFVGCLQRPELLLARRALVAQLNDVHPAGQGGVGEFGQIAALTTGICAQIEPGVGEPVTTCPAMTLVHTATLATTVGNRHGSPAHGG
jgi:hypothetical protein